MSQPKKLYPTVSPPAEDKPRPTTASTASSATNASSPASTPVSRAAGAVKNYIGIVESALKHATGLGGSSSTGNSAKSFVSSGSSTSSGASGGSTTPSASFATGKDSSAPPTASVSGAQQSGISAFRSGQPQRKLQNIQQAANLLSRAPTREQQQLDAAFETLQSNMAQYTIQRKAWNATTDEPYIAQVLPAYRRNGEPRMTIDDAIYLTDDMKKQAKLVSKLPDHFPMDKFDSMTAKQQLATVRKTNLTGEEQWTLLNAKTNLRPLSKILDIQENYLDYGLTRPEAENVCRQLLAIDNARIGTKNHDIPFGSDQARALFIKQLDAEESRLLDSSGFGESRRLTENGVDVAVFDPPEQEEPVPITKDFPVTRFFVDFGYAAKLKINPDSRYMQTLLQGMQTVIHDRRNSGNPMSRDEIFALYDGVVARATADWENSDDEARIRMNLPDSPVATIVESALDLQGLPYKWGGKGPESGGLDCSGLIRYCVSLINPKLAKSKEYFRTNASFQAENCKDAGWVIWEEGDAFQLDDLQPGDIVFWYDSVEDHEGKYENIVHTGFYVGYGQVVDASSESNEVVLQPLRLSYLDERYKVHSIARPDYTLEI